MICWCGHNIRNDLSAGRHVVCDYMAFLNVNLPVVANRVATESVPEGWLRAPRLCTNTQGP